jgi:fumarate hydratase, class II
MLLPSEAVILAFANSAIAHCVLDNDLTLRAAALKLGFVNEDEFDRIVDPPKW